MLKNFFRHLKKNRVSELYLISGALILFAGNSVACSFSTCYHYPEPIVIEKPTAAEIQANYIRMLEEEGVQVIQVGENITIVFPSDLLFFYGSSRLDPESDFLLDATVKLMETYSIINVKVAGYSDHSYSSRLTEAQAQTVSTYLWDAGANMRLVYAEGYGGANPVASNAYGSGRALNRRIEVSFQYYPISNYFF